MCKGRLRNLRRVQNLRWAREGGHRSDPLGARQALRRRERAAAAAPASVPVSYSVWISTLSDGAVRAGLRNMTAGKITQVTRAIHMKMLA